MPAFYTPLAKPKTHIRRAMTAILRSPHQVSRHPPRSSSLDKARPTISSPLLYVPPPAVALQTSCLSTDSIIITSLRRAPFCCHEDLVTMSRPELVRVAQSINGRLPKALQIACGDNLRDADIRRAIEVLVGIRAETGRCSAPVLGMSATLVDEASPWDMDVDLSATDDQTSVISSSPLSIRRPRLEILKEEQEHEEPSKHSRISTEDLHLPAGPVSPVSGSRLFENLDMSASRLLSSDSSEHVPSLTDTQENVQRRRSARLSSRSPQPREVVIRLAFSSSPKAQPAHILRSHSQRASTDSTSAQVSTLKRAQSDATGLLKRQKHHFRRGRGTPKAVDHINLPEVETLGALPIFPTRSALVDFLSPKPHIEGELTMVSHEESAIGAGVVMAT